MWPISPPLTNGYHIHEYETSISISDESYHYHRSICVNDDLLITYNLYMKLIGDCGCSVLRSTIIQHRHNNYRRVRCRI